MPSNFTNLVITWFDESDNYATSKDITEFVNSIPIFTDVGGGEVNEATIVLSGAFGQFISDEISPETVIEDFDRIRIEVTDLAGNIYDRFFEVKPGYLPTQTKPEGTLLTLDLIGTEYHTQEIHFNRAFWFFDAFDVAREIGENYQQNRGTRQPTLGTSYFIGYDQGTKIGNGLPRSTVNHYEYGLHEDYGYNRWSDQGDKLGGSVDTGGILDFFDVSFDTPSINAIDLAIFSQGSRTNDFLDDSALPTLDKSQTDTVNVGEQEGGITPATGTVLASWGAPKKGSLPTGHAKYDSGQFQFIYRPLFAIGVTYLQDAKIKFEENHYRSKVNDNTGNTPPTGAVAPLFNEDAFWIQIDMSDEFGDFINYSEWTDDKAQHWINCGSNPTNKPTVSDGTFTYHRDSGSDDNDNQFEALAPGMFDCNIVINDNSSTNNTGFFRTWVDFRATDDTELGDKANTYAYSGNTSLFPRGTRVLIDGIGSQTFGGNDLNDVPFDNNIAEWDGDGNWIVKYKPAQFGSDLQDMQVAVLDDGVIWFFDNPNWRIQQGDFAHECFHTYTSVTNTVSFREQPTETDSVEFPDVTKDGNTFLKNIDSAVTSEWDVDGLAVTNRLVNLVFALFRANDRPTSSYNRFGSWLCWRIPFSPINNGGVFLGDVYGTDTPSANFPGLEPSTLTAQNMDFTSRGEFGYTHPNSDDYGQLHSFAGVCKVNATRGQANFDGIKEVRVCFFDINDNVVYADFEVPFTNRFFGFDLPLSSFSIYRARRPVYFDLTENTGVDIKLPKELALINQFEWRNIKLMTMHLTLGYDQFQRYVPEAKGFIEGLNFNDTVAIKFGGALLKLTVDDMHFTKPLLAIAKGSTFTERSLEPEFLERTHIMLFDQLLNDARAELEKQEFQHTQYDIRSSGSEIFNFRFGDGLFYETNTLTNREDDSTAPGVKKIKVVNRRNEYSITSPGVGVGGLTRRMLVSRRFV